MIYKTYYVDKNDIDRMRNKTNLYIQSDYNFWAYNKQFSNKYIRVQKVDKTQPVINKLIVKQRWGVLDYSTGSI